MDLDGKNDRELPGQTAAVNALPSWSPDGKRVAFMTMAAVETEQHQVSVINADGTGLMTLPAPSQRSALAAWSPDGSQLLFTSGDREPQLYVSDTTGTNSRRLNPEGQGGFGGFWLAGGKRIGYTRMNLPERKGQIVLCNLDGTGEELVQTEGMPVGGPNAVSPDGKRLAYVAYDLQTMKASLRVWEFESKSELFLGDLDAHPKGFERFPLPSWMPDGKSVMVAIGTDKGSGLFSITTDGKTRTRLTPENVDCLGGAVFAPK